MAIQRTCLKQACEKAAPALLANGASMCQSVLSQVSRLPDSRCQEVCSTCCALSPNTGQEAVHDAP